MSNNECIICMERVNIFNSKKINCNCTTERIFHKKCINEWFTHNKTCPYCYKIIIETNFLSKILKICSCFSGLNDTQSPQYRSNMEVNRRNGVDRLDDNYINQI